MQENSRFATVFRHELRLFRAERLDLLVLAVLLAGIGYALANGGRWVDQQQAVLAAARAEEAGRLDEQRANLVAMAEGRYVPANSFRNPASPLWIGNRHAATYAALPPAALAVTAVGQSDLNPPYTLVNADSRDTFALNEVIDNPSNLLIGHFDLAFLIVHLLPLLVIALGYNLLSAEREQGTLGLAASNPVRLATLLAAKLASRALLVLVPVLAFTAVGLALANPQARSIEGLARFAGWSLLVVAYAGFWFALAAAVNVRGRSSAHNALVLVSLWIVLSLVLPALLSVVVGLSHPVPSRGAMIGTLRTVKTEVGKTFEANAARYAAEHESPAGVLGAKDFDAARKRLVTQQQAAAAVAEAMRGYDETLAAQRAVVDRLRFLSPAILMQDALNDVAGTGELRYAAYNAQVDAFYAEWQGYFHPKVLANTSLTLADYDRFPRFVWVEPSSSASRTRLVQAVFALLLPALLLIGFCSARIARYPVLASAEA